ncbi:protein phosphatase 1 regulatory subunit 37-like [Saccostrea cucullata]|uniref:protein phosphatase 1 regulatory subunit 37-like n=1 Tax=Saccostrea cuccullata TaxID=36930 RepID=UPI002ED636FA
MSDSENSATENIRENEEPQQLPDVVGVVPSSFEVSVQEVNNQDVQDESENRDCNTDNVKSEESTPCQLKRNVKFPADSLVKGYLDPPDPWRNAGKWTTNDLIAAYKRGCESHGVKPLNKVLQQLQGIEFTDGRFEILSLRGERLDMKQVESLESILKLLQFRCLDLEATHLDDETAVALFDMVEYYESACKVNIAFNKNISARGWQACARMIRKTPCLTFLDARNCDLNERVVPIMGRSLRMGCFLTTLHLENTSISGRSMVILVAALKMNEILTELFLADNKLMPTDGIQLGNLLKYNHKLQLLDVRNNSLQDIGVGHICDGLYEQTLDTGLLTLVLWSNQLTYQSMSAMAKALGSTQNLETLNLGHNNITNEGIHLLKEGLLVSKSLLRLGLQGTKISCEGAVALAEVVADSPRLLRLDLRENDIKTAGLMALSLSLKVNQTVTRVDLDRETKKEAGVKDYIEQQRRLQNDINAFTERNKEVQRKTEAEKRKVQKELEKKDSEKELVGLGHDTLSLLKQGSTVRRPSLLVIESAAEAMLDSPVSKNVFITPDINPILTSTPPGELLLSPQYTTAVKAKKIFTVSKVNIQSLLSPSGSVPTSLPILSPSSLLSASSALSQVDSNPTNITPSTLQAILANPILCAPLDSVPVPPEPSSNDLQTKPEENVSDFVRDIVVDLVDSVAAKCDRCHQNSGEGETPVYNVHTKTDTSNNSKNTEDTNISLPKPIRDLKVDKDSGFGSYENEQWTQIESSELPPSVMNGHATLSKAVENPNFQSSLTMNGLTEELASVLESIESKSESDPVSPPDDFERELDAMLAEVQCGNNIPFPSGKGDNPTINIMLVSLSTKGIVLCGLAGETGPRCIVPSHVKSKTGKIEKLWEFDTTDQLYENLKDFLFNLYFRHLLVNAKDRRVVICESILCPSAFRETLAKVLFKHFEVSSVLFAVGQVNCLLGLGTNTGLVVDVGYNETIVLPVYEGIPVIKALQNIPLGGKSIHKRIETQLRESGTVTTGSEEKPLSTLPDCLNEDILEDIKVRCCFVTNLQRASQIHKVTQYGEDKSKLPSPPPGVKYPVDGDHLLLVNGTIREHSCEVLFEQDNEHQSLSTIILDAIINSPIDMRRDLAENIVIIGGTSMLPGFHHRLCVELYHLLKNNKYQNELSIKLFKFHKLPTKENCACWLGGALLGALETLPSKSISRDAYLQTGKLPDWCCISEETEEQEKMGARS